MKKLYDVVLPALPKEVQRSPSLTLKLDDSVRKRFCELIRRQSRRLEPAHPTFSLDLSARVASRDPRPRMGDDAVWV